jgi:acyl dehydratase
LSVVIDPLLVLCTAVGLSVEDLSEAGGPFLGVEQVEFALPVYPGDTLTARSTVIAKRHSDSRPNFGIVTWQTEGRNQRGEIVVSFRRTNLVAKKEVDERTTGVLERSGCVLHDDGAILESAGSSR